MIKYLLLITGLFCSICAAAQNDSIAKVPIDRQYFHDLVTKEQKLTDKADGKQDGLLKVTGNDEVHLLPAYKPDKKLGGNYTWPSC